MKYQVCLAHLLSVFSLWSAAGQLVQVPQEIILSYQLTEQGALRVKIPLTEKESLTEQTFGQLAENAFNDGLPLTLVNLFYMTSSDFISETVELSALMQKHGTSDDLHVQDGDLLEKMVFAAAKNYIKLKLEAEPIGSLCLPNIICFGKHYKQLPLQKVGFQNEINGGKKVVMYTNHTLATAVLMHKFNKSSIPLAMILPGVIKQLSEHAGDA